MNSYQRSHVNMSLDYFCYECKDATTTPVLPEEMLVAVQQGNVDKIKDFIDQDHNVNASYEGETLLSKACSEGQVEVVKLLLQCPQIHVNMPTDEITPIMWAARNGHTECVKLLLDSSVVCQLQLDNCWKTLVYVLKLQPELQYKSAVRILKWAGSKGYWDVAQLLFQMQHHFLKEDLYPLVMTALDQNRWDVVCDALEKRDFYGKDDLICEVFAIAVRQRNWSRSGEMLRMMDNALRFEQQFVNAALSGKLEEVKRLMAEKQLDSHTVNGNLLVVAAGGTSEAVAELLMSVKNTYTKRSFSDALYLSAVSNCAEMMTCLLFNAEASYSVSNLYQVHKMISDQEMIDGPLSKLIQKYLDKYQDNKLDKLMP